MTRGLATKSYSMMVLLLMWMLSAAILVLSVTLWFRDRIVEPPTIAVSVTLLFALPALRNSQSGAPPIGSVEDTAGFYWNMAFISVAALLLLTNYIVKNHRVKKPILPVSMTSSSNPMVAVVTVGKQ